MASSSRPIFFLYVGMQVNVSLFLDVRTIALAFLFTLGAITGKLVAGVAAGRGADRLAVGIGMVPRGEVGLVFLGVGRGLGVFTDSLFAGGARFMSPPHSSFGCGFT